MTARLRSALAYAGFLLSFTVLLDLALGSFAAARDPSFRTAHPYYHHGLRPDRLAMTSWGGRAYTLRTDSHGFRGAAHDAPLRANGPRIVLIGDSMIEGVGVAFERTAAGLLAERGRARGIEVLNAAVVSYSPKLYELRTRWLVEREGLALSRLVVFLDVSDVHDETLYESFVPRAEPDWRDAWRGRSLVIQLAQRLDPARARIENRFRRDAEIDRWLSTVDAYRSERGDLEKGRWEWTYDETAWRAFGERGLALAEKHMAALAAFCREHSIELVVVVYPSPYQIFANERESRHTAFWRRFCEHERVAFVDLFPAFVDAERRAPLDTYDRYFIPDDVHWNEIGHAFVADLVESAVLGSPEPGAP